MKWVKRDPEAPTERADFIREWVKDLYFSDKRQVTGFLNIVKHGSEGFCCLGVASILSGLERFSKEPKKDDPIGIEKFYAFSNVNSKSKETTSLPSTLVLFLGLNNPLGGFAKSSDRKVRDKKYEDVLTFLSQLGYTTLYPPNCEGLASLNDHGISFVNIALVIRKFCHYLFKDFTEEEIAFVRNTKLEA